MNDDSEALFAKVRELLSAALCSDLVSVRHGLEADRLHELISDARRLAEELQLRSVELERTASYWRGKALERAVGG